MEIAAENLCVGHRGKPVLSGVDLVVRPAELVGLIGPNGAGKTTLLRVLAGLACPLSGTVRYGGQKPEQVGPGLSRRIAYLAQGGEVNSALSVEAVVGLGRLPHRRAFAGPDARDRESVARALALTDAAHLVGRQVATLSGGERSRVLLARALAVEAEILLADEPVAALDPLHQLGTLEVLREAVAGGAGIVVVLHDLALAARFCDRLVLVAGGRVVGYGAPADILTDSVLAGAYGIEAVRGRHDGEPFLLPWRPIGSRPTPELS